MENKQFISDEEIKKYIEINKTITGHKRGLEFDIVKKTLQQKGFEVEEPKSKLEIARWYKLEIQGHTTMTKEFVLKTIDAYEDAIKEIHEKPVISELCIDWLKHIEEYDGCLEFNEFDYDDLAEQLLKELGVNND